MDFEIEGKVAIVTGGASGIGLALVTDLLRNGAKGVTVADVNTNLGEERVKELGKAFGPGRAIFVKTDVTSQQQFENAFKKTIEEFHSVDILINSAGVYNCACWETEVKINVNGVICGIILGLEKYLQKYRGSSEAVIVNISSTAGLMLFAGEPIYSATKCAVLAASMSWGAIGHYERTKVKVLAICPSFTKTPLSIERNNIYLGEAYDKLMEVELDKYPMSTWQTTEDVSRETLRVMRKAKSGTAWIVENGEPAYQYVARELETMINNTL